MNTRTEEFQKAAYDLIYLASCAVNGIVPDQARVGQMDLDQLYQAADYHMMTAIAAMALESAGVTNNDFTQAKGKAIRKAILLETERLAVQDKLEAAGIWYMPLKGAVLKDMYPKIGMRQMSDVDILVDLDRLDDVKRIMEEQGFEYIKNGLIHENYYKPPVCNFEIHSQLLDIRTKKLVYEYYKDIQSKLKHANAYKRYFSDEDFYVYMIAHEYKHYTLGGTGLRSLLDIYVFNRNLKNEIDRVYIDGELEKLKLSDFERDNRHLSQHLFGNEGLTEADQHLLDYILASGTYGTVQNGVGNKIYSYGGGIRGRVRFILFRVFPPMYIIRTWYPAFIKYPLLLPLLPFYRLYRGITKKRKKLITEISALLYPDK